MTAMVDHPAEAILRRYHKTSEDTVGVTALWSAPIPLDGWVVMYDFDDECRVAYIGRHDNVIWSQLIGKYP